MSRIFLGNAMGFWWNPIILLTSLSVFVLVEWIRDGFGGCSRGDCGWMVVWLGIVFGTRQFRKYCVQLIREDSRNRLAHLSTKLKIEAPRLALCISVVFGLLRHTFHHTPINALQNCRNIAQPIEHQTQKKKQNMSALRRPYHQYCVRLYFAFTRT